MPVISTHPLMFNPQLSIFSTLEPIKTVLQEISLWILQTYIPKATEGSTNELRDLNLPFPGCLSFYVWTPSHNPNTWHNISAKPAIRWCDPNRQQLSLWLAADAQGREEERKAPSHQQLNNSFIYAHTPSRCKRCLNTDEGRAPTLFPAYYRVWIARDRWVLSVAFIQGVDSFNMACMSLFSVIWIVCFDVFSNSFEGCFKNKGRQRFYFNAEKILTLYMQYKHIQLYTDKTKHRLIITIVQRAMCSF